MIHSHFSSVFSGLVRCRNYLFGTMLQINSISYQEKSYNFQQILFSKHKRAGRTEEIWYFCLCLKYSTKRVQNWTWSKNWVSLPGDVFDPARPHYLTFTHISNLVENNYFLGVFHLQCTNIHLLRVWQFLVF